MFFKIEIEINKIILNNKQTKYYINNPLKMSNLNTVLENLLATVAKTEAKVDSLVALNQSQRELIVSLQTAVQALQAMQSAPRATRKSANNSSTPAGVDPATGQTTEKPPTNTVSFLKKKAVEDPNYLPSIITQTNYDNIEHKYASELVGLSEVDKRKKMAQKVWTELGKLTEQAPTQSGRDSAVRLLKYFKDSWTKEKSSAPTDKAAAPASSTANGVTNGVTVPELTTFTQPLLATPTIALQPFTVADTLKPPTYNPADNPADHVTFSGVILP